MAKTIGLVTIRSKPLNGTRLAGYSNLMAAASTLAVEFERRGIPARVSRGETERVCHTRINNIEVEVHFPTGRTDRAVNWVDGNGELHRVRDPQVSPEALADYVIESIE